MTITTIGIDLAKNVFQIHGVDGSGKTVLKKQLRRNQVLTYFIKLTTCTIGIEACGGAHYWARKLRAMGHTVKLMAPQFVKPYVKANKTDAADAEAICEAVTRPNMRFVAIKNEEQQAILSLHRARQGFVKARTAQANQIRGLLGEYGITIPQGIKYVMKDMLKLLDPPEHDLPGAFTDLLKRLHAHLLVLEEQVSDLETQINSWHSNNEYSQRLSKIPGIGPLTATALVASIADANCFRNGRELAAWLGLVPRQHSSGGRPMLLGISKRGDTYLRTLLIHGARSAVRVAKNKSSPTDKWTNEMLNRLHQNVASVARANKNARIVWALLAHGRDYNAEYKIAA